VVVVFRFVSAFAFFFFLSDIYILFFSFLFFCVLFDVWFSFNSFFGTARHPSLVILLVSVSFVFGSSSCGRWARGQQASDSFFSVSRLLCPFVFLVGFGSIFGALWCALPG
jgi:hypothetical protein